MKKKIAFSIAVILSVSLFFTSRSMVRAENARSYYDEGMSYLDKEDYEKAIEFFRKAIREDSKLPQLYNALGYSLLKKNGTVKSASKAFQKAIELDPHYADPYFNLGTYYAGPGSDPILAGEYFEKAIKADPQYSKAYMGLGWIYMEKKDAKLAVENFQKSVGLDPNLVEAQYGLGLAYVALRKNELALKPITMLRQANRYDLAQGIESMLFQDYKAQAERNAPGPNQGQTAPGAKGPEKAVGGGGAPAPKPSGANASTTNPPTSK